MLKVESMWCELELLQVYMDRLVQEAYNDLSSLRKLPVRANYHEAYNDQSSLRKLPARANYQEPGVATRSKLPYLNVQLKFVIYVWEGNNFGWLYSLGS